MRIIVLLSTLFLCSCASKELKQVSEASLEKPINTPQQVEEIRQRYGK